MSTHQTEKSGKWVWLIFCTPHTIFREKRCFYRDEPFRLELAPERLCTNASLRFVMTELAAGWRIEDREIPWEGYVLLHTAEGEEITLLTALADSALKGCSRLPVEEGQRIRAGESFSGEIFYTCGPFIKEKHFALTRVGDGWRLERQGAIYRNGFLLEEEKEGEALWLEKGERLEAAGLTVCLLPGLLICFSLTGTLRIAERKRGKPAGLCPIREGRGAAYQVPELCALPEEALCEAALELAVPEPEKKEHTQPVLLQIGPSLTMVLPVLLMTAFGGLLFSEGGAGFIKLLRL